MRLFAVGAGLAAIFAVSTTMADPPVSVSQVGAKFSVKDLAINKGQTVIFLNDDTTSHNITVTGDGNGVLVNGGLQPPGEKFEMPFAKPGTYVVTCGIHPRMRMNVVVK
jgi:cytochrome c peroxidase